MVVVRRGVAGRMDGKYRRNIMSRNKGGQSGRPGGNYLLFVGDVLGHGRMYE